MIIRDKEKKHHRVIICDDNSEQLEQMKIVCRETLHMADAANRALSPWLL